MLEYMHFAIYYGDARFAMCRSNRHYAAGTFLARQAYGLSSASSRSHRVLGRTMSSRRSPPRGNSGGFAFDVVADPRTVLAPVLDEDLVGVEPRGEHAGDVRARHVRLHRFGCVPRDAAGLIHRHADRAEEREIRSVAGQGQDEIGRNRFPFPVRIATHHDL